MTKLATHRISRKAAENAFHAVRYAKEIGTPINTHISISFSALGIGEDRASDAFIELKGKVARWWRYHYRNHAGLHPQPPAIYAHANPEGSRHVHWLIHVPKDIRSKFDEAVDARLRKIVRLDCLGNGLLIKDASAPGTLAKYIMRGVGAEFEAYFNLAAANEGMVTGRRTGTSRCVGRAARRAARWNRKAQRRLD